jgi:hypothetical protein
MYSSRIQELNLGFERACPEPHFRTETLRCVMSGPWMQLFGKPKVNIQCAEGNTTTHAPAWDGQTRNDVQANSKSAELHQTWQQTPRDALFSRKRNRSKWN